MKAEIAALGPIKQLAFVTDDVEKSVDFWTRKMGAGPFFQRHNVNKFIKGCQYFGEDVDIQFSVTIGYWEDMQIEFVRQDNDVPSIYSEWQKSSRQDMHHIGLFVKDVGHARRVALESGYEIAQEFFADEGGAFYIKTGGPFGFVELFQPTAAQFESFGQLRRAAVDWDGAHPLRVRS